jgi:hypothetical protein
MCGHGKAGKHEQSEGLVLDVLHHAGLYEGEKSFALSFEYFARLVPK